MINILLYQITNSFNHFNIWKNDYSNKIIVLLDDGSITNETRLGAVKDFEFAIVKENIKDDILVLASLKDFISISKKNLAML